MNLFLDKENIRSFQIYYDEEDQTVKFIISTKSNREFVLPMNEISETVNIFFDK